jgi:murein DD-endopeptidase MepM/ murein hydrolase activator NlpD
MKKMILVLIPAVAVAIAIILYEFFIPASRTFGRNKLLLEYLYHSKEHADWNIIAGQRCENAPFSFPTTGYIGFLWDDYFKIGHPHQGLDIFAGTGPGKVPVYAVYDGYITRQSDWRSSLILRIPNDPLEPDRQIWVYYTHMADATGVSLIDPSFSVGTKDKFVKEGTLLGYQGDYSGDPNNPVGVHLHISITKDDGNGKYLNELDIRNTLDPSPYFKMNLNALTNQTQIPQCIAELP